VQYQTTVLRLAQVPLRYRSVAQWIAIHQLAVYCGGGGGGGGGGNQGGMNPVSSTGEIIFE
jgi:hypothetical protein